MSVPGRSRFFFREPTDEDGPAILVLANRSVEGVPGAGPQNDWLRNRQQYDCSRGVRRHFVAVGSLGILGYGTVESAAPSQPNGYRIFIATTPEDRDEVGARLYDRVTEELAALDAREAWFIEYAADEKFLSFIRARGFRKVRSFRLESGTELVVLTKRLHTDTTA
jgi:hypothetical protein